MKNKMDNEQLGKKSLYHSMIKLQKKELNSKLSIKNEGNNHIKTGNGESDYINRILEKES